MKEAIAQAMDKVWFYPFKLSDGQSTRSYDEGVLDAIHHTRASMMQAEIDKRFPVQRATLTAADLACHQGWFSLQLAALGFQVTAIDARAEHIADVQLACAASGVERVRTLQSDVHELSAAGTGTFDVVLCFGLLYHLENPVGALRRAREICRNMCLVETQVVPHMGGVIDWGSYRFVKPLQGVFGIIDETEETHGPEMSTTGICLAPSVPALIWIMQKVGFREVELVVPPPDAYEQLRYGKRVMVRGYV